MEQQFIPPASDLPEQQHHTVAKKFSASKLLVFGLLVVAVGVGAFYAGMRYPVNGTQQPILVSNTTNTSTQVEQPTITPPSNPPATLPPTASTAAERLKFYENKEYGIRFALYENERVAECPIVDNYNDKMTLRIMTGQLPVPADPQAECATEGFPSDIALVKKPVSSQDFTNYIQQLKENGYSVNSNSAILSGINGIRVQAKRDTTISSPLPESIDQLMFEKDRKQYFIPASYLTRDVSFAD